MGYNTGSLDGPKFYVVVKKRHNNLYYRRPITDKYIGFDIDSKKTIACVVQRGKKRQIHNIKNGHQSNEGIPPHFLLLGPSISSEAACV